MSRYDDMLRVWGLEKLADAGFKVSDSSKVYVDFDSEWSGGCGTCGWDVNYIVVAYRGNIKARITYDTYSVEGLLAEVMEFAVRREKV